MQRRPRLDFPVQCITSSAGEIDARMLSSAMWTDEL